MAALTANFEADFSSFYDACKQAVVELNSFEKGAAQVEDKLDRMTNRFSGQKVISDAQLMTEAIERLGGVSTLTEAELARVGKTTGEAVEKMKALGMDVPKGMEDLAKATKGAGESTDTLSVSVTNLVGSYLTAEAAIRLAESAFDALVSSVEAVVAAASEGEQAEAGLLAALKAQGTAVPSVVEAYDQYAKVLQQTTIYSDTAAKAAETLLVQIGGVMPKDMDRALTAAANLAAVLKIDLSSAAMMVAKAAEGQTAALSKAGVVITGTKEGAADFSSVLDQLEHQLGGAAEAAGNTFAGSLAKLSNAWGSVLEATGRVIVNNATWAAAVDGITTILADNTTELNKNATANNLVSDAVILAVQGAGLLIDVLDALQKEVNEDTAFFHALGAKIQEFAIYMSEAARAAAQLTAITSSGLVRQNAIETVDKINWYIDRMNDKLAANKQAIADAQGRSEAWSASLGGFRTQLDGLVASLEATRGKTRELAATAEENDSVWQAITANMKANALEQEKAAKAAEAQRDALAVLASVSEDFHVTVAALNPELVASIENYLRAGVAADTLAKAYGLTSAQIGAVAKALQEEQQVIKLTDAIAAEHAKLQLQYWRVMGSTSHDTIQAQKDELYAWADAQQKAMEKAKTLTQQTSDDIKGIVKATLDAIDQKHLESIPGTEAYYKKIADETEAYYQFVLSHIDQFTNEAVIDAQNAAQDAKRDLDDWYGAALKAGKAGADAGHNTAAGFREGAGAIRDTTAALHQTAAALEQVISGTVQAGTGFDDMLYAAQHLTAEWVNMAGGPGGGWIRSEGFGSAAALNKSAGARAAGGPVAAGVPYVVGEEGPELFVPTDAGTIVPNGAASGSEAAVEAAAASHKAVASQIEDLDAWAGAVETTQNQTLPTTRAYFQAMADGATTAYESAFGAFETFADQSEGKARASTAASAAAYDEWSVAVAAALDSVTAAAGRASAYLDDVLRAFDDMRGRTAVNQVAGPGALDPAAAIAQLGTTSLDELASIAGGQTAVGGGWLGGIFSSAGQLNDQAVARQLLAYFLGGGTVPGMAATMGGQTLFPHFGFMAAGGPVAAGGAYVVGERGPELFVPPSSGTIVPNGGGGARVVVEAGAIVMNYPIVNNPQALDQLARTVGDAILARVTRAGARL